MVPAFITGVTAALAGVLSISTQTVMCSEAAALVSPSSICLSTAGANNRPRRCCRIPTQIPMRSFSATIPQEQQHNRHVDGKSTQITVVSPHIIGKVDLPRLFLDSISRPNNNVSHRRTSTFGPPLRGQQRRRSDNPWTALIPSPFVFQNRNGLDIRMEWSDPRQGAFDMMEAVACQLRNPNVANDNDEARRELQAYFESFATFCQEHASSMDGEDKCLSLLSSSAAQNGHGVHPSTHHHSHAGPSRSFRARLVATRGAAGTKCPNWHVDHVPVRWIQALVGRGCDYVVDEKGVDRSVLLHSFDKDEDEGDGEDDDDESTTGHKTLDTRTYPRPAPSLLVDPALANIQQAREGQVMLLLGNRWRCRPSPPQQDDADNVDDMESEGKPVQLSSNTRMVSPKSSSSSFIPNPAIHKSPTLFPGEPRVLLTIDVVQHTH